MLAPPKPSKDSADVQSSQKVIERNQNAKMEMKEKISNMKEKQKLVEY